MGYYKPLLAATVKLFIDELNVMGYGPEHNKYTIDDDIRFESISFDGTIESTHLIVRRKENDVTVLNTQYTQTTFISNFSQVGLEKK